MFRPIPAACLAATLLSTAAPALAEDPAPQDGTGLMQRGVELFWEGLREEMAPTLQDLQGLMEEIGPSLADFLSEMGPALAEIASEVEDWSTYELPEILPNGDIIIRKKQPVPAPDDTPTPDENGVTDI